MLRRHRLLRPRVVPAHVSGLDLSNPVGIRAAMARRGLAPGHTHAYDDPDRGWVNPLDDRETQGDVRALLAELWQACLNVERVNNVPRQHI